MKIAGVDVQVSIENCKDSVFGKAIYELFKRTRPTKIIETGTYVGTGSTNTIASAIQSLELKSTFFSIEVNPQFIEKARKNLGQLNDYVSLVHGLSVPRQMLPTSEQLKNDMILNPEFDDILVDHREGVRVNRYMAETGFIHSSDEMLKICLERFHYFPDFVLLDSGGHVGNLEFNYLISMLRGECFIALDDIFHVKHHKSFLQIQNDKRFSDTVVLNEGTGHCITKFTKA